MDSPREASRSGAAFPAVVPPPSGLRCREPPTTTAARIATAAIQAARSRAGGEGTRDAAGATGAIAGDCNISTASGRLRYHANEGLDPFEGNAAAGTEPPESWLRVRRSSRAQCVESRSEPLLRIHRRMPSYRPAFHRAHIRMPRCRCALLHSGPWPVRGPCSLRFPGSTLAVTLCR